MHHGILSCAANSPLGEVATVMATHRVHAVAVTNEHALRPAGIVSDLDVVAAAAKGEEPTAVELAGPQPLAVCAEDSIRHAAQLMAEHRVAHLIVHESASGYPIGVLSTLDVAAVL